MCQRYAALPFLSSGQLRPCSSLLWDAMLRVEQQLQPSHAVGEWTSTASMLRHGAAGWCRGLTWDHALRSPLVPLSASSAARSAFWGAHWALGVLVVGGTAGGPACHVCALVFLMCYMVCSRQPLLYACVSNMLQPACCVYFVLAHGGSAVLGPLPPCQLVVVFVSGVFMLGINSYPWTTPTAMFLALPRWAATR